MSAPAPASLDNPLFARWFARFGARNEARGQARLRAAMLAGLAGRVLEVGPGTGLNFRHYPPGVEEVVAVEPEPRLRRTAAEAAAQAPVPVTVVPGVAADLPAGNGVFDAVVLSGLLCSVPDAGAALAEAQRVLRGGGQLRFYEHVRSRAPGFAAYQRAAAPVWAALMGGCRPDRDTYTAIGAAGFAIESCRGLVFPAGARLSVVGPRILGTARAARGPGGAPG